MNVFVIVPTLNAASNWATFAPALLANIPADKICILDSSSTDETAELARRAGMLVHIVPRADFNHGGTRQLAVTLLPEAEILIYLTQDAVLTSPDSLKTLLHVFADHEVAAAYGRQLPRPGAGPIESHARLFNYPALGDKRTLAARERLGLRAIFISNSFSAYRRQFLQDVGGFPSDVIFGEDTVIAAKSLLAGFKVAYVAEATVYHSHGYKCIDEFRRYFDIGVLHHRESWLRRDFGSASGEGKRFVLSELRYLWPRYFWLVPSALIRTTLKLIGYRLGGIEEKLTVSLKRKLSMHRHFWNERR